MGALMVLSLVVLGLMVGAVLYAVAMYNQLVKLEQRCHNGFAQIEVQLKRRYDLIPNLVETAKGYLSHERETLTAVIEARNRAMEGLRTVASDLTNPAAIKALGNAEGALTSALGRLSVVVEQYPELKANETIARVSEELTSTENRVAFARQAFNDAVTDYNTYKTQFPAVLVAGVAGHARDAQLLELGDRAEFGQTPRVSF